MLSPGTKELQIFNMQRDATAGVDIAASNVVQIAKRMGIQINPATMSQAMSGQIKFQSAVADRLIELLDDLKQVKTMFTLPEDLLRIQQGFGISNPAARCPIDFTQHEVICDCLLLLRLQRIRDEEARA